MALQYSKTKFGETFSTAYVKVTRLSINFSRTETHCVAEYVIRPSNANFEVMETRQIQFELTDMSVTTPEQQAYNYLTTNVSEFSSASTVS